MPVETRSMLNSGRSRRISSRTANKVKSNLAKNRSRRQSVKKVNTSKSKVRAKQMQSIRKRTASTQETNRSAKVSSNRDLGIGKSILSPFRQFFTGFLGGQDTVSKPASSPKSVDASEAFEGTFAFGSADMEFSVGAA